MLNKYQDFSNTSTEQKQSTEQTKKQQSRFGTTPRKTKSRKGKSQIVRWEVDSDHLQEACCILHILPIKEHKRKRITLENARFQKLLRQLARQRQNETKDNDYRFRNILVFVCLKITGFDESCPKRVSIPHTRAEVVSICTSKVDSASAASILFNPLEITLGKELS